jgi:hypothetical protein
MLGSSLGPSEYDASFVIAIQPTACAAQGRLYYYAVCTVAVRCTPRKSG